MGENFIPHITLPARITDHSASLIDHILIRPNKPTVGEAIVSGNIYSDISDHLPNFICFGENETNNKPQRPLIIRIFGDKNTSIFKNKRPV